MVQPINGNYDKVMPKLRRMDYKIEYDMMIKKLISDTLRNTNVPNINKMLQYMDQNGYYSCRSHSHNNWYGGASQHMWAVYLIAKKLRKQRIKEPYVAQYATDEKIAIVCLLHDLCDMPVRVFNDNREEITGHGSKSYWIMKNLGVGTEVERMVVKNHMHGNLTIDSNNQDEIDEYNVLHSIITKADHIASGTAWNSKRFKEGRTQRHGVVTKDHSYLRAVAMDRTVQSGLYHMYMDENFKLGTYRNYNRKNIKWEIAPNNLSSLDDKKISVSTADDIITEAHKYSVRTGEQCCLVIGIEADIPNDKDTRLRRGRIDEQDILICSNLLNAFYYCKKCEEKGKRRFRFEFTMRDEIKEQYRKLQKQGVIYLPNVKMIRDGRGRGFPFVKPWTVDIMLVKGMKCPMFVIPKS